MTTLAVATFKRGDDVTALSARDISAPRGRGSGCCRASGVSLNSGSRVDENGDSSRQPEISARYVYRAAPLIDAALSPPLQRRTRAWCGRCFSSHKPAKRENI